MASLDIIPPDLQTIIPPNFKSQANSLNSKILMVYGPGSDPSRKYKTEAANALQYIRMNGATADGLYELKQALYQNNKNLPTPIPDIAAYRAEIVAKVKARKAAAAQKANPTILGSMGLQSSKPPSKSSSSRSSSKSSSSSRSSSKSSTKSKSRRGGKIRKTRKIRKIRKTKKYT